MSEGAVKPNSGSTVVPEAHEVDTYHVPDAFFKYVPLGFIRHAT